MTTLTTPRTQSLLVELLTEELPPKALQKLGRAFAEGIRASLDDRHLLASDSVTTDFATPRRLAAHLSGVLQQAPEQRYTEKLMPVKVGLTGTGEATAALIKKLAGKGLAHLTPADLDRVSDGKQDYLYATGTAIGATLQEGVQAALDYTITHLPIPKVMRYQLADGLTSVKFVRPAHGLVTLWGSDVIPAHALGLNAGRDTQGHRFMSSGEIDIMSADSYQRQLLEQGKVIAPFGTRRELIAGQLAAKALQLGASLGDGPEVEALLDEVTALVEYPAVYVGEFDPGFLHVPPECLILTMRLNQKYFPLFDPDTSRLTHRFLIVSNMLVDNPVHIVEGNQRVVRPRLADARFFFDTDRKTPLVERVDALAGRVYHHKLGSQLERIGRVRQIAGYVAEQLAADCAHVDRAALLAKADLSTHMVAEFPELQGIMGAYYAAADNEPDDVVQALREQYRTRFDTAVTPATLTAAVLFIAERLETLVGIWGIGLMPTGERDPYGLRRAALGLISAFEQLRAGGYLADQDPLRLNLDDLLRFTAGTFAPHPLAESTVPHVQGFIYERYRHMLNSDYDRRVVDAVLCLQPPLHQVAARVRACEQFSQRPEADSLAAANKRIANLLKKASENPGRLNQQTLTEPAELALARTMQAVGPQAQAQFDQGDYAASLATLAQTRDAVDVFFNDVMVMADDPAVRANRLALLADLHRIMNQVADISRLAQ